MVGFDQPFMYDAVRSSSQFPEKDFDPKAVTRASWEPKPRKPKVKGPLVAFGRHPDAHQVPSGRTSTFRPMSGTTKWWIRWTRYLQLVLRSFELVAGLGLVVLMILISNVQPELVWVMRIVPGVVAISCIYSLYHHARPARERPPASSAAYQLFSAVHDAAATGLYAFGAVVVHSQGSEWTSLLESSSNKNLAATVLVPAEYWALVGAAGLHAASLGVSTYLALMFRRITHMPPDLNPLEDHLTRRAHKRNKSSVATTVASWESIADSSNSTKRISTRLEEQRRSGAPYEDLAVRPPSIPFMHTRTGSKESFASLPSPTLTSPTTPNAKRDSRADLPSRQYQILPGKVNPTSANASAKRMSAPPASRQQQQQQGRRQQRGSYAEIPLHDPVPLPLVTSRPASIAGSQSLHKSNSKPSTPTSGGPRTPRFTETWYASDSLVGRTQERLRAAEQEKKQQEQEQEQPRNNQGRAYEAILQPYDNPFDSDDESDRENHAAATMGPDRRYEQLSDSYDEESDYDDAAEELGEEEGRRSLYPDPLRAHPPIKHTGRKNTPSPQRPRSKTPLRQPLSAALSVINPNTRSASNGSSRDIVEEGSNAYKLSVPKSSDRTGAGLGRNRDSSIQPEDTFYSRPYGDLKPATPPVMMVGSKATRQVSSGHDYYDLGAGGNGGYGPRSYRRNVSGKVAEEGLAGPAAQQTGGGGGYSRNILKGFMASMPT